MKTPLTRHVLGAALAAVLLAGAANAGPPRPQWQILYKIELLPDLGGLATSGASINDRGWIAGQSNRTGDAVSRALLWRSGQPPKDLGTLGGDSSAVLWPVKNVVGIVSGIAQTNEDDPNDEIWSCGYFLPSVGNRCLGFRWQNGTMTALNPFPGGTHSFATGTNNLGQTVGWAENAVRDPECVSPQVLQFRAALWPTGKNQPRELPPLPGDQASSATAINDRGQVVGISGACSDAVGGLSAKRNVLWTHGVPENIGDFGGIAWNTPMMINQRGDVVGFANISADVGIAFRPRAFLWTRAGGIKRLPLLPAHDADQKGRGQALGINEWGQIAGQSCNNNSDPALRDCRAVIWRDGVPADLNVLASPSLGTVRLTAANDIDDLGRITGVANDGGDLIAFKATPYLTTGR